MVKKGSIKKALSQKKALDLRIILDGQFYTEEDTTFDLTCKRKQELMNNLTS